MTGRVVFCLARRLLRLDQRLVNNETDRAKMVANDQLRHVYAEISSRRTSREIGDEKSPPLLESRDRLTGKPNPTKLEVRERREGQRHGGGRAGGRAGERLYRASKTPSPPRRVWIRVYRDGFDANASRSVSESHVLIMRP